ncbi:DDE-type integrase/transposase/recombinase [Actinoplanes sp. NPDC051411]|uniref:DDE-type integrase/transposase/recombinase n=1 Tax=Actinoplanes sp. NPDC051411 TaxID=3155522 RepID=UPI003437F989
MERLMRSADCKASTGAAGTVRDPDAAPSADLVRRRFTADRPDAWWVTELTQHRTGQGRVYCAVVLEVFARRVVGWSIADHPTTELVTDALDMARRRRVVLPVHATRTAGPAEPRDPAGTRERDLRMDRSREEAQNRRSPKIKGRHGHAQS